MSENQTHVRYNEAAGRCVNSPGLGHPRLDGGNVTDSTQCPSCGRDCVNPGGLAAHAGSCKRLCSVSDCDDPVKARGWCANHYRRWRRHGDPEVRLRVADAPGTCTVEGCQADYRARGFCARHYKRWLLHGSTDLPVVTTWDRFWAKVDVGHALGCWVWTGAKHPLGYGNFNAPGGSVSAHRWAFEALRGFIPERPLELDHMCRNPSCVNPDHLEPVTHVENVRRGAAGRYAGNRKRSA